MGADKNGFGIPTIMNRSFPSIILSRQGIVAQGAFAEAQAAFLEPDPQTSAKLREAAERHQAGIVAHFYMDPELQGVLAASGHPHIHISDSLVMADRAVDMAAAGARVIIVLGVDFMAENVRAVMDAAGYRHVPVYRVASGPIGCSLAEAADTAEYLGWLHQAARLENGLHVVYINTSLLTKAHSQAIIPTITCTSSNVVNTVLCAFAQIPEVRVWFGPDTYMGQNLRFLFETLQEIPPEAIRQLHPDHDRNTLARVVDGFEFFPRGNCVVHHLFGDEVAKRVATDYADALITAHLEVPSAMFRLGLAAQRAGRGVVGSTSDILRFTEHSVRTAIARQSSTPVRVVLGTEAGMVTALVRKIRSALESSDGHDVKVEIIFPVADTAVARTSDVSLPIVPGVAGGEGCSIEGGCATCPYMKMNSLDALLALLARLDGDERELLLFAPNMRQGSIEGRPLIDWASAPIQSMREFTKLGRLPEGLLEDVRCRSAAGS